MKTSPVEAHLIGVPEFDDMDDDCAEAAVRPSCPSERWVAYLVRTRPHRSLGQLMAASDDALRRLDWPDIEQALGPLAASLIAPSARLRRGVGRSGRRPGPRSDVVQPDRGSPVPADLTVELTRYEQRFGHSFLSSGSSRTAPDLLAQLLIRLGHSPEFERRVVRAELRKTVRLRLAMTFCSADGV